MRKATKRFLLYLCRCRKFAARAAGSRDLRTNAETYRWNALSKRTLILVVVALVIVGALLHRESPRGGIVMTTGAMALYLLAQVRMTVNNLRHFRTVSGRRKVQAIVAVAMLLVLVSAWSTGSVYYFMLLVLLAADYLMTESTSA